LTDKLKLFNLTVWRMLQSIRR